MRSQSLLFAFTLLLCALISCSQAQSKSDTDKIFGFIVPHSHDDVGWIRTVDEYYNTYVRYIYEEVVSSLIQDSRRRFISVEMAYFTRWYYNQASSTQRDQVKKLVKSGQLEFIVGGWTMEDEACPTFSTNIDQMSEGHRFLYDTFGVVPKFGWQIDPFGASNVAHRHFAEMGFDATIISRVDWRLKQQWEQDHDLQFMWKPSQNSQTTVFTHMMDQYSYTTAVHGLDWSSIDPPVNSNNIKNLSDSIVNNIKQRHGWFSNSNIVLFPWGTDFDHRVATTDFKNMDQLLDYINENQDSYGVTVKYATLGEYFEALHNLNLTYRTVEDVDFFPYNDGDVSFWTGYYTSRPALKWYARRAESGLRTAEVLNTIASVVADTTDYDTESSISKIETLRQASGIVTHHDAVAGTSEPYVVKDYINRLKEGLENADEVSLNALGELMRQDSQTGPSLTSDASVLQNVDSSRSASVTVFNNLAWEVTRFVQLPVFRTDLVVTNSDGEIVEMDIFPSAPSYPEPCQVNEACGFPAVEGLDNFLDDSTNCTAPYTLFFAARLPPLGFSTFFVKVSTTSSSLVKEHHATEGTLSLSNSFLELNFNNDTGELIAMRNKISNVFTSARATMYEYSAESDVSLTPQPEGAYIFNPKGEATPVTDRPISYQVYKGKYVEEIRLEITEPCSSNTFSTTCGLFTTYRVYKLNGLSSVENFVEVLHSVGPIEVNKDIVIRYSTDLDSQEIFYTDNNCFEIQERRYNASKTEPFAGNYYPVTCNAFLKDVNGGRQLTLLSDRTHGGSSLKAGDIEVMLHRRTWSTDYRGIVRLDDTDRLENMQFLLIFDTAAHTAVIRHTLQYLQQFPPYVAYTVYPSTQPWNYASQYSALATQFPPKMHLLTFSIPSSSRPKESLLRVLNLCEAEDGCQEVLEVDLDAYFGRAILLEERTLNGIQDVSVLENRWNWNVTDSEVSKVAMKDNTLEPLQIRTFSAIVV